MEWVVSVLSGTASETITIPARAPRAHHTTPRRQMEQCLMEGRYNKVHAGRADVPHEYYTVFMDILMETIREEVASCVEQVGIVVAGWLWWN